MIPRVHPSPQHFKLQLQNSSALATIDCVSCTNELSPPTFPTNLALEPTRYTMPPNPLLLCRPRRSQISRRQRVSAVPGYLYSKDAAYHSTRLYLISMDGSTRCHAIPLVYRTNKIDILPDSLDSTTGPRS